MSDDLTIQGLEDLVEQPAPPATAGQSLSDDGNNPQLLGPNRNGSWTSDIKELRNATDPQYINLREQWYHRTVAYMKAAGSSNVEIARVTGKSQACINYLVRQPYMVEMIGEEVKKTGDEAMTTLRNATNEAAVALVEIARTSENVETKRKACNDILDRKYGKPNQPYSVRDVKAEDVSDAELLAVIKEAQQKN
jgi:hypothetical protein